MNLKISTTTITTMVMVVVIRSVEVGPDAELAGA